MWAKIFCFVLVESKTDSIKNALVQSEPIICTLRKDLLSMSWNQSTSDITKKSRAPILITVFLKYIFHCYFSFAFFLQFVAFRSRNALIAASDWLVLPILDAVFSLFSRLLGFARDPSIAFDTDLQAFLM